MKSFDNLSKAGMGFSLIGAADLDASARTLHEETSRMGWWIYTTISLTLPLTMVKCLFVAGTRCQLLIANTASTIWWKQCCTG